jgi:DNA-binding transcriptional ArsR family regulator
MSWYVSWKDNRGMNSVYYDNIGAVMNHVEYCLKHGWRVYNIYAAPQVEGRKRSLFAVNARPYNERGAETDRQILEALKDKESMTVMEIAQVVKSSARTDSTRRREIRDRMYRLRDRGLVVSVPNWNNESKWTLKKVEE